jgi:P-type Mg2+ transporter
MRPSAQATPRSGPDAFWSVALEELLAAAAASTQGLSAAEAARRLTRDGPNTIEVAHPHRGLRLLVAQFTSPIVLILVAATVLSMALGDLSDGLIILVIVAASGALGFWQERTAGQAVDALMAQVRVEVEVRRGGGEVSVPVEEVVVGDLLVLRAGDVVPADCRVVGSQELLVDEAALTGESYAVEKRPGVVAADTPLAARSNSLFMGTHVVSGAGEAIVARTGRATQFGAVSARLGARRLKTGFERGLIAFGVLLVRAMVVLVTAIFVINLVLHRPVVDSLLFSLALAVGLTPHPAPLVRRRCDPVPERLVHRVDRHRAGRHAGAAHQPALLPQPARPGAAVVLGRHRRHHRRPALQPPGRAARPDRGPRRDPGHPGRAHRALRHRQ